MPWNPDQNDKDPWGRDKNKPQGPPDLDALFRQYKNKLLAFLGSKDGGSGGGGHLGTRRANVFLGGLIVLAILVIWVLSGIFIVAPADRAVIQRFGRYAETLGPGPHWIAPFIESKRIVNIQQVSTYSYQAEMLTKDQNIVSVSVTVQYRILDAANFLFKVVDPVASLEQATASALRMAVGHNTLDSLLTTGRSIIREQVFTQLQEMLSNYQSGIMLTDVTLQTIRPPEEVTAAFDDVIKAQEDKHAFINKANAYANQVLGQAQGRTARVQQEAQAYAQEVVLAAQGGTASYLALLPQYHKAPEVTKDRLYLTAMETILGNSSKIFLDQKQGNPILYLPLDKMMSQATQQTTSAERVPASTDTDTSKTPSSTSILEGRTSYPSRGNN